MAERTEYRFFVGMFSATDPHDLEPGQARVQVNCWSPRQGELIVRPGLREMEFEDE